MNKMIRMALATILSLALLLAVAAPAMAAWGTMYVNKSKVDVYKKDSTDSKVIKTLKGGKKVVVDAVSPNGKWAQITVDDTKKGGQRLGFVQMKYLSEDMPQQFCSHSWGKWKVTEEATCTETGKRVRTCKICGKKQSETIKKLAHSYGSWKITEEATCSEEGTRVRTCKNCGHKDVQEYLEDHTYGKWSVTKEATCTEKGERVRKCSVCGYRDKQSMNMLPHEYEWQVLVETTDHSAGTRAKICTVCGKNGGEESFDPEGTLRRGNRGEDVYNMQQLLVDQGYLNAGGADGIFGGGSEKAVMQFQKDQSLDPDGIAWPQTLKRLAHDFGPWETVKEMTRTEAGERVRVCKDCGYEQHEIIESGTVMERGRRGEDVRALQQIVKELGYDAGSFDGIYGKKLDNALAGFAADNELTVESGKIRPADVDALINAWLEATAEGTWKGEGDVDSAVNLALTVTPMSDAAEDSDTTTYQWSLTNLGSRKCTFAALLLTYGDDPDFRQENLVMALDGIELKAGADNSTSGSFTVGAEWGEGDLNFAALAIDDSTGDKWLSNTVTYALNDTGVEE